MNEKNISPHSPLPTPHAPFPTVMCKRWFCGLGIAIFNTIFFGVNCAIAQITPDRTLPNNSIVTQNGSTFNITGGTQAGGNLFHSFNSFSVPTGSEAFFHNGVDIQNIITRVTGGSRSNIDGIIHTLFTANLFLINPSGIVFGQNASLNVGGSFIGSTAKSINFADGTIFSSSPTEPTALLTVSVPLGLQFSSNPGEITVTGPGHEFEYSTVPTEGPRPQLDTSVPGLAVQSGQTLALVGGQVSVKGGVLKAPTGRIEIGSVDSQSTVNLVPVQLGWTLGYPEASSLGDIQISGKSFVSTTGVGGGSIAIVGKNINLNGQSILVADTLGDTNGGTTRISGETIIVDQSLISSNTYGSGSGGQIELDANNITFNNKSGLVVQTQGKGDGGTINVLAKNSLQIQGQNVEGQGAALASSTQGNSTGTGNAGDVNVKVTGPIEAHNVAITTKTLDAGGNAGNINITGNSLDLETANIVGSTTNTGKGGEININVAGPLTVKSASINTGTSDGTGDAGKINITANSFQLESTAISSAGENSTGKAGDITIKVPGQLTIDKAAINTLTSGTGDAGKIDIDAGSIELVSGGSLNTTTSGKGKAGTINITANSFLLKEGASINSSTGANSTGTAGDITLNVTGPLTIMNQLEGNPAINSNTSGTGDAGKINITANSFQVEGAGISSSAGVNGTGKAGDITVKVVGPLTIDKAAINTDTSGTGDAGKIDIDAGSIELASGGGLNTNTNGKGKAGTINITANSFVLKEGGFINSSTGANSTGTAGDITLNVTGPLTIMNQLEGNPAINSNTSGTGDAGKINITANSFQVEGAGISSSAGVNSTGKAGDITVKVAGSLTIDKAAINTDTSGTGDAGKIDIDAGSIELASGGSLNTNTNGKGDAGTINIKANSFQIESSIINSITGVNSTGKAGDITFNVAGKLTIDQAAIKTDTSGTGDAGKIKINANSFQVESTDINSSTEVNSTGKAGEINIDAGSIEVGSGGGLNTNTNGKGDAGTINIKANSFLLKDGEINSITELNSTGNAGDITVNVAGQLRIESTISTETNGIRNAGQITTEAKGIGNAGQITVTAESLKINNGSINATSRSGKGGNIDLEIGNLLLLRHQGSISTTAGTAGAGGDGGNITINVPNGFIVAIPSENSDITANAFTGRGGNITINRSGLYGISPRPQLTPLSDITAFSQRGINGKISINQPAFEQHLELAKLPKVFADISLLDRSCSAIASTVSDNDSNTQQSQFIVTGRGGLPPNPYDPLSGDAVWSDNRQPRITSQQQRREKPKAKPPSQGKVVEINPATGWVFNGNGFVTLFPTVMCKRWFCGLGIAIFNTIFFGVNCAIAQIPTPDRTLPNNSIVTQNGSTFNITGGTQAGGNLFHSFKEFSVPTGSEALFHNGVDIQNIITRVTGGSISNIDGIIHTLFTANLFLINPSGIVFGPNASLNVGGSFIGSTAKSINFADGTIFSSTPTESAALLTVSVPLGLQFGSNPGEIKVLGPGYNFSYDTVTQQTRPQLDPMVPGLAVPSGQTLALVGGQVSVEGGVLSSPTGRIEIGSVNSFQAVNLVPVQLGWMLGYPDASSLGDIQISGKSFVSTTGVGGGFIAIVGKNINLSGQSILVGDTLGDRDGGTTRISGENIVVDQSLISSNTYGSGSGGQIQLDANNITFQNQGSVVVQTQGKGDGGTINVVGKNSLQIDGGEGGSLASSAQENSTGNAGDVNVKVTGPIELRNVGINSDTFGTGGNAGNINITGNSLVLENAGVSASTTNTGIGGQINIHVVDSLKVDSVAITTDTSGTGDAGKINITANSFQVKGADISSSTYSTGKAGEINIDAGSIEIGPNAGLNTNTFDKGDAGTINIKGNSFLLKGEINSNTEENSTGNAGDITVNVAGPLKIDKALITTNTAGTGDAGKINITANSFQVATAGINSRTSENSIGKAGDITVNVAGSLTLDNSTISTKADGIGNAGKITITAEFLKLDNAINEPSISATSTSGKGGDIDLEIGNLLLLRHQPKGSISTTAGNAGTGGDGGNITINAPKGFIVAIPSENSDITANAFTGNGGIITINASGLYGISPRPQPTPLSDITAFSQRGVGGKISINRPDVDQHLELSKLPKVFADMSLLNASCSALANTFSDIDSNPKKSKFIITGRGGLPPNPYDPLSGDVVWSDTRLPNISEQQQRLEKPKAKPPSKGKVVEINPATGWVFNGNGEVTLISQKDMSNGLQSTPTTCQTSQ